MKHTCFQAVNRDIATLTLRDHENFTLSEEGIDV
jgi:hypothetical protein